VLTADGFRDKKVYELPWPKETLMNPNIVKQYRATLQLTHPKPRTCELVGDDINTLKTDITNILGGGVNAVKFEPAQATVGSPGLTLIYHPSFNKGETPCGWISVFELPQTMSVGASIERLVEAAA
jgi:hypothetical protein